MATNFTMINGAAVSQADIQAQRMAGMEAAKMASLKTTKQTKETVEAHYTTESLQKTAKENKNKPLTVEQVQKAREEGTEKATKAIEKHSKFALNEKPNPYEYDTLKNTEKKEIKSDLYREYGNNFFELTTYDGSPSDNTAKDYYVPFRDYIKNVASSEIYATWPESTITANVLAILSFSAGMATPAKRMASAL